MDDCVYRIEAVGYEETHHEEISLKNISFSNSSFQANISGTLCIPDTNYEKNYVIENQYVSFTQVYGALWSADINVSDSIEPIRIYGDRYGSSYTGNSMIVDCEGINFTAVERESYSYIKYLFYGSITYLRFS